MISRTTRPLGNHDGNGDIDEKKREEARGFILAVKPAEVFNEVARVKYRNCRIIWI